ncbi:MAG TPA: galactokinase family protein, partial [Acidobacteriota bacterium]|nr:galactokinase family protein [Acidobacteriota bacterium]
MTRSFESFFNRKPEVRSEAPGRVNIIGEHTDYNGGFVLPFPIPQKTKCELSKRNDTSVRVASVSVEEDAQLGEYKLGDEKKHEKWWDYVQAVTFVLRDFFTMTGFDARFETEVLLGSGLSSSAALAISLLRALREAFRLELDDFQMVRVGRTAENTFVGAKVGIMDQMAATFGRQGNAMFIDTLSLKYEYIPLPSGCAWTAVHSGLQHELRSGYYNLRRQECEEARRLLGVAQLRDLK